MIRLIKILCFFWRPNFKWLESNSKYSPAWVDDWGNNWQAKYPEFNLEFGLREDLDNSYSVWLVKKYHPRYRLEAYRIIMKMVILGWH